MYLFVSSSDVCKQQWGIYWAELAMLLTVQCPGWLTMTHLPSWELPLVNLHRNARRGGQLPETRFLERRCKQHPTTRMLSKTSVTPTAPPIRSTVLLSSSSREEASVPLVAAPLDLREGREGLSPGGGGNRPSPLVLIQRETFSLSYRVENKHFFFF